MIAMQPQPMKGLTTMTTYNTTTLAIAVIGEEKVEENKKSATRTLRKFLRDEAVQAGGKVGTDTPGKGGRYSIDMNKRELTSMIKRFKAWEIAQEEARKEREAARNTAKITAPVETDDDTETDNEPIEDDELEEPTADDLDAMIAEIANGDDDD